MPHDAGPGSAPRIPIHPAAWLGLAALLLCALGCGGPDAKRIFVAAVPIGPTASLPVFSADEYTYSIFSNVYEPLVDLDADLRLEPAVAESWYTLPDGLTWVFKLRAGLSFHDGSSLTAQDVVASVETARSHRDSKVRPDLAFVTRVYAAGDGTVRIATREPDPALPNRLAAVTIQRPSPASPNGYAGTGPYRLVAWTRGGDARLEAFHAYRSGPARVRRAEFRVIPLEDGRLARVASGEVDLAMDISPGRSHEGIRIVSRYGLQVHFLVMDSARARTPYASGASNPFRDVRVRRAVSHAVDRRALVEATLAGEAEPVEQIVAPEVFGFRLGLPPLEYDPASARALLVAAGFTDGFEVSLDVISADGQTEGPEVGKLVADLGEVGIRARPRAASEPEVLRRIEEADTSFCLLRWMSTGGDAGLTYNYLVHSASGSLGSHNGGRFSDPQVDALLAAANRETDSRARGELLRQVADRVREQMAVVPLFRKADRYAMRAGLRYRPRLDRQVRIANMWPEGG